MMTVNATTKSAERKYEEQEKKDDNDDASNANGVDDYY